MSGSEVSEMDVDYQSEDGEIKIQKSPLDKEKQNEDILSFSLSEEDADDTADSLDIKPPQAASIHTYKSRSHREKRSHRDKDRRTFGHSSHISRGDSLSGASSHKKSHHHSREHREHREERHREREKRHHRDKHNISGDSKRDRADYGVDDRGRENSRNLHREDGVYRSREDGEGGKIVVERVSYSESRLRDVRDGRDVRESREVREMRESREVREFRDHREPRESRESREIREQRESRNREEVRPESRSDARAQDKVIEDLREQLLDKRRSDTDSRDRTRDRDRRIRKRDRREAERFLQQSQEQQPQQPQAPPPQAAQQAEKEQEKQTVPAPKEPPVKKADKVERDMRREKLLLANREIDRQKEVVRRELAARRARRHLEEEKERTLESIAKKRERSLSRERKRRRGEGEGDENMEDDDLEKGDSDDSVKEILIEPKNKSPKGGDRSSDEDDTDSSSEGSTEEGEESDSDSGGGRTTERVSDDENPLRNGNDDHDQELDRSASETESEHSHPGENGKQASPVATPPPSPRPPSPSLPPPPPVDPFAGLPQYLPAIQGCRSVEEFQCLNRIEEGTYGVVYRARDKRTDEIVALKRLKMEKEKEGFPITSLREINTLLKAQHQNIVTVREIVVGSNMDKIFIVMDYVEHDLKSLMETMRHKKQAFSAGEVKCLMHQLLKAVNHLHDNWILHRDLKTSNLLLSHKGVLKVGDFGLAREYGSPLKAYTPIVVTLWYRSPELLLCTKEYSTPVDMWSVGCIYAEFLLMEALFPGKSEIDQLNRIFKELGTPNDRQWPGFSKMPAVQKMNFAEYPINQLRSRFGAVSSDLGIDLLNKFLTYDPSKRITAEDALNHQYFKESPVAIDPQMFPTWPAKSELGHRKAAAASPKPPSGGKEYKQLGEGDEDAPIGGFHMGGAGLERSRVTVGAGFSLKF